MLNLLFAAIVLSGLYALIGFAWVLLARTTGILNLATGAYIALGAFSFNELATTLNLAWPLVAIGTVLTLFAMAGLTHMAVFRRLAGQPEFTLVIATLGLAAIIKGATSITWGGEARLMRSPIEDEPLSLAGGINTTTYGIIGIIVAILFLSLALSYFRFSTTGVRMQAAAENPILAALGRIRIDRMYILGWFMALSAATTAGILFSYQTALTYQGLETIGLRGVAPALVGGLTSIKGIVPGAFIVAAAEILGVHWFGGEASHVAAWVVVFIVLMIRPYGLFGSQRVERV